MNKSKAHDPIIASLQPGPAGEKEILEAELIFANKELGEQNKEIESRAAELIIANNELVFQNEEKEKRAAELIIANKELAFQNHEKEKRAAELIIANEELAFQNHEKEMRAAELVVANEELAYQNQEKEKRAAELSIANKELVFQFHEKEKHARELVLLSGALEHQKEELKKANARLHVKAVLLQQHEEKLREINDRLEKRVLERTAELEVLNQELKVLNVSKDKFVAVISHDLRNPLTALLLASEALTTQADSNLYDSVQPFVKVIHRSSHNILQQLNELVAWAQKQQENTTLSPERIHLLTAVQQSFELLSANALLKNIFLENSTPANLYVQADALMLRSILQNLVTNSIKYSFAGGVVKVTACKIDAMMEICVTDCGMGMDSVTKNNLFGKSKSHSESGTSNEKGSGLGLVLVNDFVTQHKGALRVESELKKGTSIYFTIPGCK